MTDRFGLELAAERGVMLGEVGQKILIENEYIRMWEVRLAPGETIDFHIHYHPYLVISLGGGENQIETIFGNKIKTDEPFGSFVFINEMRAVHRLTNHADVPYISRLIELKQSRWSVNEGEDA